MYDLSGRVALVTGAAGRRGIGRAIALRLAEEGADIAINDLPGAGLEAGEGWGGLRAVSEEVRSLGRAALALEGDVADAQAMDAMVEQTVAQLGRLDILVCNAAAPPGLDRGRVVDLDPKAFDTVLRVNVTGAFLGARAAARQMVAQGSGGRILVVSSCLAVRPRATYAAYSASKAAQVALVQALALELAPFGITVHALCPGPVDTERFEAVGRVLAPQLGRSPEAIAARILADRAAEIPLGRVAQPADVARIAAFLASEEAAYLTGLAVPVTGGWVMP